jgi:hypothetical protein
MGMDNPRMEIGASDLERTMNLMRLSEAEDLGEKVRKTFLMLGDCFPSGNGRDASGATYRQVLYIVSLAAFDGEEAIRFCRVARDAGGLDSNQAHHLIKGLLAAKRRSGKT